MRLFITNDIDLQQESDLVFVLEKGKLKASGTYEQVKPYLKGL